jgi:hypothetical protein
MLAALLVTTSTVVGAGERDTATQAGGREQQKQWRAFDAEMSPWEYEQAVRENQKLVRRLVKTYSNETLTSAGVPKAGVAFLGAAAGLAVDGDAHLHLNKSKTMAFSLDDVASDDRALMFSIKKSW